MMLWRSNGYTTNMWRNVLKTVFVIFTAFELTAQLAPEPMDIKIRKSGPYLGIQRGKYTILELGGEMQWKQVKLKSPVTHAVHTGFNYNFKYNVLGYDLGYWVKPSRLGLTYGGNLVLRTDFNENRVGFAPVLGYKLFGFHLQTGYHFLSRASYFTETNGFFVSLRFVLINNRDVDVDRKKIFKRSK